MDISNIILYPDVIELEQRPKNIGIIGMLWPKFLTILYNILYHD